MTSATLYAPEVDNLMRIHNSHSPDLILPLDLYAQTLIALLHNIVPLHDTRSLWITSERGPIEAFGTYDPHGDGVFESYEQFKEHWLACYPEECQWYRLTYTEHDDVRRLTINDRLSIRFIAHAPDDDDPAFVMQLMSWLITGVEECVRQCAQGTYNTWVREQLPFTMRTGVLSRKDYWTVFPESLAYVRSIVSDEDIRRFEAVFCAQAPYTQSKQACSVDLFTLNDYFDVCRVVYSTMQLQAPCDAHSSEDWYRRYANPRGQTSLEMLDRSSPQEFASWIADSRANEYTWQILPGPSFSWLTLMPLHGEHGWILQLGSAAYPMCADAMRVALALHDVGYPVRVQHAYNMLHMVRGEDTIGILPQYVMPPYDDISFPDDSICELITLPFDHTEDVIAQTHWYPITPVHIIDQSAYELVNSVDNNDELHNTIMQCHSRKYT